MKLTVRVTQEKHSDYRFPSWDTACGHAVREALDGATAVVVIDTDGAEYTIWASRAEDNS